MMIDRYIFIFSIFDLSYDSFGQNYKQIDSLFNSSLKSSDSLLMVVNEMHENVHKVLVFKYYDDSIHYRFLFFYGSENKFESDTSIIFIKYKQDIRKLIINYISDRLKNITPYSDINFNDRKIYFVSNKFRKESLMNDFDRNFIYNVNVLVYRELYNQFLPPAVISFQGFPEFHIDQKNIDSYKWISKKGKYLLWDIKTGYVKLYSRKNEFLGTFNPDTGEIIDNVPH